MFRVISATVTVIFALSGQSTTEWYQKDSNACLL